jgi:hypothetical protein
MISRKRCCRMYYGWKRWTEIGTLHIREFVTTNLRCCFDGMQAQGDGGTVAVGREICTWTCFWWVARV